MKNLSMIDRFYKLVKNKFTVPRWIIFILDLCICAFAIFFAFLLRFNMDFKAVSEYGFIMQIELVTALNIIFFRLFRTYEGIIRFSSAQEGLRCVWAVFCSSFCLLISIVVSAIFKWPYLVPISVLIIYFFTASFLIFAYRIAVKKLYRKSLKRKWTAENVLIFVKTTNGAFIKNAIESITDHQYKVVGFIEEDDNLWGKSIDNTKFYSFEQVKSIAGKYNVKTIFMSTDDLDVEKKNKIVDYCLSKKIGVKVIPAVEKWVDGQLQTRQLKNFKIEDLLNRPSIKLAPDHLQEYLTGKRILITGAAGSIGGEIVKQLMGIRLELLVLCDNRETGIYELQYELQQMAGKRDNIVISISDVRSADVMQNLFESFKPQIVFHAAAYKHVPLMEMHPCEAIKNNVLGTKVIADLSVLYGVDRFVLISTDKAVNPTNVMGASKRIAEKYVAELQTSQLLTKRSPKGIFDARDIKDLFYMKGNTKFITTRFGNVLDSNGSVLPRFQEQINKGGPVTVTHPDIMRYFMTIPEACSLVLEAVTMGQGGEIFVFDMGEPVKIVDLANMMIKLEGLIPGRDIRIEFTGLRPGEKLYEELLNKNEQVIPTHHKKIMISKVNNSGQNTIFKDVIQLIEIAGRNDNISVVKHMKMIVEEYKSKNSAYESLDGGGKPGLISISEQNDNI